MKAPFIFAFLFLAFQSFSQSNKFSFGVEYSPSFTNVTNQVLFPYETGFWPVNNLFVRVEYADSSKFDLTTGIGLMTSRQFEYLDANGQQGIEEIKSHRYHKYIVLPFGFKYKLGSFFINPDLGIGWNYANKIESEINYTNGYLITTKSEDNLAQEDNLTFPVSLGFGNKMQLKSCSILIGIRGYYSLDKLTTTKGFYEGHYYGFGAFGGISF